MGVGLTILKKLEDLVREIAAANDIPLYKVEAGVTRQRQQDGTGLELPVIRITSYLEDSISTLAAALNTELDIARIVPDTNDVPWCASTNQTQYLAGLKPNRADLLEYRGLNNRKFTIEIRSVIQDTLSGLERHLGLDQADVPDAVKRELFKVSTLLEMADRELLRLQQPITTAITTDNIATISAGAAYTTAAITVAATDAPAEDKRAKTTQAAVNVVAPQKAGAIAEPTKEEETPTTEAKEPETSYIVTAPLPPHGSNGNQHAPNINGHAVNGSTNGHNHLNGSANGHHINGSTNGHAHMNGEEHNTIIYEAPTPAQHGHDLYESVDDQAVITYASLREFVKNSALLKEIDSRIAAQAGAKLNDEIDIDGDMERLNFLQVHTLKQLHEKIAGNKQEMIAFAEKWIGRDNGGSFDSGIGLFYLEYVLVAERNDAAFATEYVLKFIADNDYSARYIIPTYTSIKSGDKQQHTYAPTSFKK